MSGSTSGTLRLSVVTPTFNRSARLRRVLDALGRQTVSPDLFEVVVVDDGSSDGTSEALRSARYPYELRAFRQDNGGPARARNRGVAEARGELVLFLDDDVEPLPALLAEHLRSHDAEPGPLVVMGPLASLPRYEQPWVAWEQEKVEEQYAAMKRGLYEPSYRQFWTGNASLGREQILATGGFDTSLLRGEDVELGARLHARGLQFRFNPDAIGLHHAERSLESWSHAHRSYGRMEIEMYGDDRQQEMLVIAAENYLDLHVGTRVALRGCLGRPALSRSLERTLKLWLTSKVANRAPAVSSAVCGLLANLLYWQEAANVLGDARFAQILELARQRAHLRVAGS